MASKPKIDETNEAALQAVEDALALEIDDIDVDDLEEHDIDEDEIEIDIDDLDLEDTIANALDDDFDEDKDLSANQDDNFVELEKRLADAANDLREDVVDDDSSTGSYFSADTPSKAKDAEIDPFATSGYPETADASGLDKYKRDDSSTESASAQSASLSSDLSMEAPTPANDDRQDSIADLVFALQRKPQSRILWLTGLLSLIWLGICGYYAYANYGPIITSIKTVQDVLLIPNLFLLTGIAIIPILLLWSFAIMVRRAQEMRYAAHSMTEAAIRLLQPEHVAQESITTVGKAIRREVAAIGTGIERALARAGELEVLIQNEVVNLERSYGDSEIKLRGLIQEMGNEREAIIGHADRLKQSIGDSHISFSKELADASTQIEDSVAGATEEMSAALEARRVSVSVSLAVAGESLVSLLSSSGEELKLRLESGKEDFTKALEHQAEAMTQQINLSGNAFAKLLDTRTASMKAQGSEITAQLNDAMISRAKEFQSTITNAGSSLQNSLDERLTTIQTSLSDRGDKLISDLSERTDNLHKVLDVRTEKIGETIGASLDKHITHIETTITDRGTKLVTDLSTRTDRLDQVLAARTDKIGETIGERLSGFGKTLTTHVDESVGKLKDRTDALQVNVEQIDTQLSTQIDEMEENLITHSNKLGKTLQTTDSAISNMLDANVKNMAEKALEISINLHEQNQTFSASMNEQSDTLNETFGIKSEIILKGLADGETSLADTLNKSADAINVNIEASREKLAGTLDEQTKGFENQNTAMQKNIDAGREKLAETLEAQSRDIEQQSNLIQENFEANREKLAETLVEQSRGIEQQNRVVKESLDSSREKLTETLEDQSKEFSLQNQAIQISLETNRTQLAETLQEQTKEFGVLNQSVQNNLESSRNKLVETLAEQTKEIEQQNQSIQDNLQANRAKLAETMEEQSRGLEQQNVAIQGNLLAGQANIDETLKNHSANLQKNMEIAQISLSSSLVENSALVAETLDQGQKNLASTIAETGVSTAFKMDEKAKQISELLSDRVASINVSLGRNLIETQKTLESKTQELNDSLSSHSTHLSSIIDNEVKPVMDGITVAGDMAVERLRSTGMEVLEATDSLTARIDASVTQASDNLRQANETLSADSADVLSRLSNTTGELKSLITNVSDSINRFDQDITRQSDSISQTVAQSGIELEKTRELAAGTTANFSSVTTHMIENMAEIANRFESQGRVLQEATRVIDSAQNNLGTTLESRQVALDELATGLVLRSEEIERSMSSFGDMISNMIESGNEKTREISGAFTNEISTAINQSTDKFATASQDMRDAAKEVQRELEETRAQMRRGVLELPDETRENAEAMRRVVTDQISALKSLSDIVAKSGKKLDSAPPVAANVATMAAPVAPPLQRSVEPARQQFSSATSGNATPGIAPAANLTPPPASANVGGLRDTIAPSPAPSTLAPTTAAGGAPQPYQAPPAPAAATPPRQGSEDGGWVSNLLRRASEGDDYSPAQGGQNTVGTDARTPQHVAESLNSLSMDIARVIDHETSIELWDRYRRGERDVFTRRLHSIQNPQTLTEINTRFMRDEEFRNPVNRYIQDFERLLADIAGNDPDKSIAESYLATDIGKVYLMLAKATGRRT